MVPIPLMPYNGYSNSAFVIMPKLNLRHTLIIGTFTTCNLSYCQVLQVLEQLRPYILWLKSLLVGQCSRIMFIWRENMPEASRSDSESISFFFWLLGIINLNSALCAGIFRLFSMMTWAGHQDPPELRVFGKWDAARLSNFESKGF